MVRVLAMAMAMAAMCFWAGSAGAATLLDDSGRKVEIKPPYLRIVSLYAAHSENLFALGAGGQVAAVTKSVTYPPAAAKKPHLSHRDGPERLAAPQPDLVLVRPMIVNGYPHLVERLTRLGITVVSLQPADVPEMLRYWRKLGLLTGREKEAEEMVRRFERGVAGIKARVADVPPEKRPGVYFESIHRKMKTITPGSMADFALAAAGGRNLAGDAEAVKGTNIAAFGKERILALGPRLDVYLAQVGPMNQVNVDDIRRETGFSAIKAVTAGRVHLVPEELASRPTMRLLEGMRLIQKLLFPSRFGKGE